MAITRKKIVSKSKILKDSIPLPLTKKDSAPGASRVPIKGGGALRTRGPRITASHTSLPNGGRRVNSSVEGVTPAARSGPSEKERRWHGSPARTSATEAERAKEARERALAVAEAGLEKKALDIEIIDVSGKVDYADYLVLMTGRSDRHVASIVQGIEANLRKKNIRAIAVEGLPVANWVLVDFADVVVHVFQESARGLYDIDGLWMDARRIPVPKDPQETGTS